MSNPTPTETPAPVAAVVDALAALLLLALVTAGGAWRGWRADPRPPLAARVAASASLRPA